MAAPTVRQCSPQRSACRSTSCGTTLTGLLWSPRMSSINFKRLLSSLTPRKGDWALEFKFPPTLTQIMVLESSSCWLPKTVLPRSVNPGPWRTARPRLCSSKWKRPTRCPRPLRTGSWPTRGVRGNSTATASLHSRFTSPSRSFLSPRSRSPRAHRLMEGGSDSEGGSLPPSYLDEDPERMKHSKITADLLSWLHFLITLAQYVFDHSLLCFSLEPGRKQKTPKKFTGEQPSISGTFGLKGKNGTISLT